VLVSHLHKEILVVFRGSQPPVDRPGIVDWITDLNILPVGKREFGPGATVHNGFLKQFEDSVARDGTTRSATDFLQLVPYLNEQHPDYRVVVTGHSLGAGVATVCAARLFPLLQESTSKFLITFGSPRVGNKKFVEWLTGLANVCCYRVVNGYDVVTKVPTLPILWHHVGRVLWLTKGRVLLCNPRRPPFAVQCICPFSVLDHNMYGSRGYVHNIRKHLVEADIDLVAQPQRSATTDMPRLLDGRARGTKAERYCKQL
jgi:hypothetical protein